jgi:hypothetical protein
MRRMKIALERLDAGALRVDLPGSDGGNGDAIAIASTAALRGTLEQSDERLVLSGVAAEGVVLDALRLTLDRLVLSTASAVTLAGVEVALEQTASALSLDVTATSLVAAALDVAVDDVLVRGRATLTGARLSVRGDEGSLSAERVELAGFLLRIGDLELAAEGLDGVSVQIAWGAAGFRLDATSIAGPALRMTAKDTRVEARGVALSALSVAGAGFTLGSGTAEALQTALALSTAPSTREPSAGAGSEPVVDWGFLDALSGEIDVDVAVDVTVPIIGHRKATHRLRVAVADGALDFRALERNLAALEDALLDFSVREGALVLERVNPLFPKRGHGKPIVFWDVDAADHELAGRDRVRLAVLPSARVAGNDAPSGEPTSIALRELALLQIDAHLALAPTERRLAGPLVGQVRPRSFGSLALAGNVFHDRGDVAPRDGSLRGEVTDLSVGIVGLALGTTHLDIGSLVAASVTPLQLSFAGTSPKHLDVSIASLRLDTVALH